MEVKFGGGVPLDSLIYGGVGSIRRTSDRGDKYAYLFSRAGEE